MTKEKLNEKLIEVIKQNNIRYKLVAKEFDRIRYIIPSANGDDDCEVININVFDTDEMEAVVNTNVRVLRCVEEDEIGMYGFGIKADFTPTIENVVEVIKRHMDGYYCFEYVKDGKKRNIVLKGDRANLENLRANVEVKYDARVTRVYDYNHVVDLRYN